MGYWKDEDDDCIGYVEQLIELNYIEEKTALGVAKQFVNDGFQSLSDKQKYVLETYVLGENKVEDCKRCASPIPWSEMLEALDHGHCSYCWHMKHKE